MNTGNSSMQPLSWNLRMKVALGVAKGLAFLHSADTQILYGKLKISDILLDSNHNAKLSDFGLLEDANSDDDRRPDSPRYIIRHPDIAPESHFTDIRLEGLYKPRAAAKAATLTLQCLSMEPKNRPSMDEIVVALEQLQDSN